LHLCARHDSPEPLDAPGNTIHTTVFAVSSAAMLLLAVLLLLLLVVMLLMILVGTTAPARAKRGISSNSNLMSRHESVESVDG